MSKRLLIVICIALAGLTVSITPTIAGGASWKAWLYSYQTGHRIEDMAEWLLAQGYPVAG